jgi:polyisoprenoid-binding protein YceI
MQTAAQRGLATVKFLIDPSVSRFTVQAFAAGLLSAFGHNPTIGIRDYEGEIHCVPATYEKAFVRVTVRTGTMDVLDEMKNDDRKKLEQLMYQEVLEIDRFPIVVYESKEIKLQKPSSEMLLASVNGELSFRGVTQNHSFEARVTDMGAMLRISGEFSLRQSDYGIKPVSFAGGALRLKDEIKFKFDLAARVQD